MDIKKSVKNAQKLLGIAKLRKPQVKPINRILEGGDTMVIAPVAAGKSAIYQIPALIFEGMTLVIEPTLSLIYDQVQRLRRLGIKAAYLDSSMPKHERERVLDQIRRQKIKLLLITPERLQNQSFQRAIAATKIDQMVVDECHCVTAWGHSFREDYLKIGKFVDGLAERPVITALTATAAPRERKEIGALLSMKNPECFVNSLYRPNLHYLKQVHVSDEVKLKALKKLLRKRAEGSCIIYCNTKKMTDAVYEQVSAWYPNQTAKCHSNLYGMTRKANETAFLNGEKTIMVAISAFGMGIDQSKVNLVIHFNMPLSLADYYQQSGRAGREGQKSKCVLLYCENDYYVNRVLLADIANAKARKGALQALDRMKEYAESTGCLTQQLLNELGEQMDKPCGSCTNCQRRRKKK